MTKTVLTATTKDFGTFNIVSTGLKHIVERNDVEIGIVNRDRDILSGWI